MILPCLRAWYCLQHWRDVTDWAMLEACHHIHRRRSCRRRFYRPQDFSPLFPAINDVLISRISIIIIDKSLRIIISHIVSHNTTKSHGASSAAKWRLPCSIVSRPYHTLGLIKEIIVSIWKCDSTHYTHTLVDNYLQCFTAMFRAAAILTSDD